MSLLLDRTFKRTAFERHHPPQQNPVHPSSARDLLHLVITLSSTASASFELLRACAHTAFSRSIVRRKVRRIAEQDHSIVVSFSEFYLPPNPGGPPRPWNPGGPPKPGGPPNPGGPPAGGNPAVICYLYCTRSRPYVQLTRSTWRTSTSTKTRRRSSKAWRATEAWRSAESSTRSSNARRRPGQTNWQAASCRTCDTRSSGQRRSSRRPTRGSSKSRSRVGGRWSVDGQRDDVRATNDGESNGASLLGLGDLLGCAGRGLSSSSCAAELFCVGEDEVHVLRVLSARSLCIAPRRRTLSNASICPTICLPS